MFNALTSKFSTEIKFVIDVVDSLSASILSNGEMKVGKYFRHTGVIGFRFLFIKCQEFVTRISTKGLFLPEN